MMIGDSAYAAANGAIQKSPSSQQMMEQCRTWIEWYLIQEDHDFMVEVDREFIRDKQNLIKLREVCGSQGKPMDKKRFKKAIKMIASNKVPSEEEL
jgi:hypothetical protein